MKIQYDKNLEVGELCNNLAPYRDRVKAIINAANFSVPESALNTWQDELMRDSVNDLRVKMGTVKHVVVVGIGGSNLGTEAIHEALTDEKAAQLHVLDLISDTKVSRLTRKLKGTKKYDIAVCIISKSGGTTETMSNAAVLLDQLSELYGESICDRVVCIGDMGNRLLKLGEEMGMHTLAMRESVGGRYSAFTPVGLVPLILLGHDINELLDGLKAASSTEYEEMTADSAVCLYQHIQSGVRTLNFFVFDERLATLGAWYRQLAAESLGKTETRAGARNELGFIPIISTPTELHSIGQLYFSGFKGVYTDFLVLEDRPLVHYVPRDSQLADKVKGKSLSEVAYAIESGVLAAYKEKGLAHRKFILSKLSEFDVGIFMGMRMLETMYVAELMDVNAFNQPNVELYKQKTKEVLEG